MENLNYSFVSLINNLGYDIIRFQMYLSYVTEIDKNIIFFEQFLINTDSVKKYEDFPEAVREEYCKTCGYDSFDSLPEYYSYELFCKAYNMSMYDESLIESKKTCENCIFSRDCVSLDSEDHYLGCLNNENFEEVAPDYVCDFHIFDATKVDSLFEEYKLERKLHIN